MHSTSTFSLYSGFLHGWVCLCASILPGGIVTELLCIALLDLQSKTHCCMNGAVHHSHNRLNTTACFIFAVTRHHVRSAFVTGAGLRLPMRWHPSCLVSLNPARLSCPLCTGWSRWLRLCGSAWHPMLRPLGHPRLQMRRCRSPSKVCGCRERLDSGVKRAAGCQSSLALSALSHACLVVSLCSSSHSSASGPVTLCRDACLSVGGCRRDERPVLYPNAFHLAPEEISFAHCPKLHAVSLEPCRLTLRLITRLLAYPWVYMLARLHPCALASLHACMHTRLLYDMRTCLLGCIHFACVLSCPAACPPS